MVSSTTRTIEMVSSRMCGCWSTQHANKRLVEKGYGDSFEDTQLETVLSELQVGHLIVAGAQTDACIRSTLHGAIARGYDALLVSDAHTTEDQSQWGAPLN
jgi:nicotinamidase-related amidase